MKNTFNFLLVLGFGLIAQPAQVNAQANTQRWECKLDIRFADEPAKTIYRAHAIVTENTGLLEARSTTAYHVDYPGEIPYENVGPELIIKHWATREEILGDAALNYYVSEAGVDLAQVGGALVLDVWPNMNERLSLAKIIEVQDQRNRPLLMMASFYYNFFGYCNRPTVQD